MRYILFLLAICVLHSAGLAFTEDNLRQYSAATPVKDRAGVQTRAEFSRLYNARVMYRLSYLALTGDPLHAALDKQIEGVRRPWAPYKPLPTPDQLGYTALGLEPEGNWSDEGFFNLYLNDVGLEYTEPRVRTSRLPAQLNVEFTWENSQGRVIQTFVLRENDDKLLMRLQVEPKPGVTLERVVLRLRNQPKIGNTAYGNPATRSNTAATTAGESHAGARVDFAPGQCWAAYYNPDLGYTPSGLLFLPGEVTRGHLLVGKEDVQTVLFLDPKRLRYHFALWEIPKLSNAAFLAYLHGQGGVLKDALTRLVDKDWVQPLPATDTEPLHLDNAIYAPTAAEQRSGYVLGTQDEFEFADANSLPAGACRELALSACPGQPQPASFLLYALKNLGKVTLTVSDLAGPGGKKIPAAQCDLRVVHVWPQRISLWGGPTDTFVMTPELLLRNDTLPLADAGTGTSIRGLITGPVVTVIPRDQARQFFLSVTVPGQTAPGLYRGKIAIMPAGGAAGELPVSVQVLPFTLRSADDRYILGVYYRGKPFPAPTPDNAEASEYISVEQFRADMKTIRGLGFNALFTMVPSGNVTPEQYLDTVFPVLKELGFRSPVVVSSWGFAYNGKFDDETNAKHRALIETYLRHCKEHNYLTPSFYGIDEPTAARYNGIEVTRKRGEITRGVSYQDLKGTYTVAGNTLSELYGTVDYPIVSAYFTNRPEMQTQCKEYLARGVTPLYYWQMWGEYPKGTRLNAGYFLYASGYRGIFPFVYGMFGGNPYQEYDTMKAMGIAYPSADGPVFTLQSEALRTGLIDLRYLLTLDDLLKQVEARPGGAGVAKEMRDHFDILLKKYGYEDSRYWGRMIYGALNWPDHQATVPNRQFDQDRAEVVQMILACQGALKAK